MLHQSFTIIDQLLNAAELLRFETVLLLLMTAAAL
jgi:hypothetical protein